MANNKLANKILWKINGRDVDLREDESLDILNFIDQILGFPSLEEDYNGARVMPVNFIRKGSKDNDNKEWIENNLGKVIKYFYYISKVLEVYSKKSLICCEYKIGVKHHTITTSQLYGHLRFIGAIDKSIARAKFTSVKEKHKEFWWKQIFNYEQFEVRNESTTKLFAFFIKTDGISASLCYTKHIVAEPSVPMALGDFRQLNDDNDHGD